MSLAREEQVKDTKAHPVPDFCIGDLAMPSNHTRNA